jgi:carboxyl-terminal processing protease
MKKEINEKKNINIILVAISFFILGFYISLYFKKDNNTEKQFSLFWKVWNVMEEKYPFEEPNYDEKMYDAINGLVASYHDEHSVFFPPKYSKQFQEEVDGEFGGAGMEITMKEGYLFVIAPLKNSPAEKAGVKAGDIITHIEGVEVYKQDIFELINLIRGEVGSVLNITVVRLSKQETINLTITRDIIKIPVLDTENIDDVFIISLYNFNEDSMSEFRVALEEFKASKKKYLLLDLRNNPGGYLSEAINLLSYFLNQGEILVRENYGDVRKEEKIDRSKGFGLIKDIDFKLGVLINRGSASASEIVAGALQDSNKALIIGETSYGKGSVQELINLDEKTSLKVTVARWLTPNKKQISKKGIEPDVLIDNIFEKKDEEIISESIDALHEHFLKKLLN